MQRICANNLLDSGIETPPIRMQLTLLDPSIHHTWEETKAPHTREETQASHTWEEIQAPRTREETQA